MPAARGDDRGYFCFPEVDINIPFTPGMAALIQAKTTPQTAITAMSTGHRYPGTEAKAAGLVDDTAAEAEIVTRRSGVSSRSSARTAPLSAPSNPRCSVPSLRRWPGPGGVSL